MAEFHHVDRADARCLASTTASGKIPRVTQQVIDALRSFADESLADRNDSPVSDRALLSDRVRVIVPPGSLKARHDVCSAGISFGRH